MTPIFTGANISNLMFMGVSFVEYTIYTPITLGTYYSLSIEAKRGSVNSTSHLNSGFVYVHVRETVPKPGRLLGLNTESRFSTL